MENVTHSLTGFFLSRAGLNRFTPHASVLLVLAANAPDIDILTVAGGGLTYFHFHRHLTHSILFAPALAIILVALLQLFLRLTRREPLRWLPAMLIALAGIASHLLLDLSNEYGERLLLPFSGKWLAGDLCAIYDLWIFAFFLFCLAAPLLSRLVGNEIGASTRRRYPNAGFPFLALTFLLLYDGGRYLLHQRALAILNSREYDDAPAVRVAAFPNPSNPFRWRGLAETASAYRIYELDLVATASFDPAQGRVTFKHEPSPIIDAARETEPCRVLRDFARFPVWQTSPSDTGGSDMVVTLHDMRFPFSCEAVTGPSGKILASEFHFGK